MYSKSPYDGDMEIELFANRIRELRVAAKLRQSDLAKLLDLDCEDRLSHWENGKAMPNVINLFRLSKILKVLPHELYPNLFQSLDDM